MKTPAPAPRLAAITLAARATCANGAVLMPVKGNCVELVLSWNCRYDEAPAELQRFLSEAASTPTHVSRR